MTQRFKITFVLIFFFFLSFTLVATAQNPKCDNYTNCLVSIKEYANDDSISAKDFNSNVELISCNVTCKVISYRLTYEYRGEPADYTGTGNKIPDSVIKNFRIAPEGNLFIDCVNALNKEGQVIVLKWRLYVLK